MSSRNLNRNSNATSSEHEPYTESVHSEDQAGAEEVSSIYSESIATIRSDEEDDDAVSTITEGSEWGDEFAPWELQVKSNEFTVRDLVTMKKEYQFRVVAVNAAGRSRPSKASDLIRPRPDQKRPHPPRALRNVGTTPNSIALQWEAPEDNGGADILGYAIQFRAGRSKQWKEVVVDLKELSYNVLDLTEGMDYVFRVHCYNIVGVSDWLENLEPITAKCMYDPPGVPRSLRIMDVTADAVELKWREPVFNGGTEITQYTIERQDKGTPKWFKVGDEAAGDARQAIINDVNEKAECRFRIYAENEAGQGDVSQPTEYVMIQDPLSPPSPPFDVQFVEIRQGYVILSWKSPATDGGSDVLGYYIERNMILADGTENWARCAATKGNETEGNVTGLRNGREYKFRVVAYNCAGMSSPSEATDEVEAKDPDAQPWHQINHEEIILVAGQKLRLQVSYGGSPQPNLEWKKDEKDFKKELGIRVQSTKAASSIFVPAVNRDHQGRYVATIENKIDTVYATCRVIVHDRPGQPQKLQIGAITKNTCELSWQEPQDNGGCKIEYYSIFKQEEGRRTWGLVNPEVTKCEWKVEDLIPETNYLFKIVAVNKVGAGEPLLSTEHVKSIDPVDKPTCPLDLSVRDVTSSSCLLKWNRPESDGGSPIIGYQIEFSEKDMDVWSVLAHNLEGTKYQCRELIEGKEYEFRIHAKNRELNSKWAYFGVIRASDPLALPVIEVIKSEDSEAEAEARAGRDLKVACNIFANPYPSVTWYHINEEGQSLQASEQRALDIFSAILGIVQPEDIPPELLTNVNAPEVTNLDEGYEGEQEGAANSIVAGRKEDALPPQRQKGAAFTKFLEAQDAKITDPEIILTVEVKDEDAEVFWKKDKKEINLESGKYEVSSDGNQRKLIVKMPRLADTGRFSCWKGTNSYTEAVITFRNEDGKSQKDLDDAEEAARKAAEDASRALTVAEENEIFLERLFQESQPQFLGASDKVSVQSEAKDSKNGHFEVIVKNCTRKNRGRYLIIAENNQGRSYSIINVNVLDVPGCPQEPWSYTEPWSNAISLEWNSPEDDGGSDITGFTLQRKELERPQLGWTLIQTNIPLTQFRVTNLREDRTYQFRVAAENKLGHSPWLWSRIYKPALPFDPPAKPDVPTVSHVTRVQAFLNWVEPNNGGSPIQGYYLEKKSSQGEKFIKVIRKPIDGLSYLISDNLVENMKYQFRVIAFNEAGMSPPSDPTAEVTIEDPTYPPGKPIVRVSDSTKSTIKLSWDAPEEDGNVGKENLSFVVEQLIDEENWSALTSEPIKTLDYEATDLKDQTKYSFRVKTINKAGESPYHTITDAVARDRFEIPLIKLDEQLTQSDMVRHRANERFWIKATVTGRPFPEIVWKHNDKLIDNETNPEMEFSEDQISQSPIGNWMKTIKSGQIEMYIRRPERKHWGNYKITARNCVGSKNVTTAINILDIPSPPLHVRPATVTKDFIAIAWNKPQDNGGSLVTEYIVEKRDMSMFAWLPCGKTEKLSMEVNSVLETQTYMFRVAAVNAQGRSKWADSQTVTCQDPLHPPGRPEHVKVMAKLDTALTVQWVPPRNNGGSKIKGYVVDKKHFKKIEKKKKEIDEDGNEIETTDEDLTEAKEEVKEKKMTPQDLEKMSPADRKAWEKEQKRIAKEQAEKEAAEEEKLWEPCNQLLIPPLKIPTDPMDFRIEGLIYNERYQFRIKAVNDVGESEPAFTQQFVSKEDDCEPSITIDVGVRNVITAFRGDMISIPAHVHAVPEAHVTWTFDECEGGSHLIPVTPKELLQDTSEEKPHHELHVLNGNNYNLLIRKCERSDVGFYICRATNIHGSKYVRVQLDVNAVASPPLNFVPAEITANSCFLSWRPPEDDGSDDGGDSIMNYVVEMLEGRKREWTSCSQTVVETKFRVCQLTEGTEYTFRVAAENRFGIGEWAYTEPIIAKNPYNVPGECQAPKIDEARKDYIIVNWQPPKENGGASIEGYWLEVQDNDNIRWRKVQRAPITKPPMARCDFRLTEVMEGIEYRFRVAAVNAAGAGPMSDPSEYAMASDPIFPPSAPGKPDTEDTSDSSISLSWSQPQKMGGTDLTGYILEIMDEITCLWQVVSYQSEEERQAKKDAAEAAKREAEENEAKIASERAASEEANFTIEWAKDNKIEGELSDAQKTECADAFKKKKAKEALGLGNEKNDKEDSLRKKASVKNYDEDDFIKHSMFTVEGLKKGFRYQFRVKAVNKAGESPFSFATAPIECRELIEAPMITLDAGLKDQFEIHSGSTIRIRANIEARPAATHKWVFEDGKDLAKEAQIESTDGTSVLVIPNANRSHSGKYTLIAKNSGGVRQCACRVLVFDTPSFPIKFEVVGVNKKSVKLQWQTPALDGGSRIDHYVVDKRREDMRAWTRCESAVGGLQYQVHDLIETEQYYFRVSAVNSVGQGQFAFTTDPVIVRDPVGISDPPYQLKINKITARTVSLSWKAPEFTGNLPITTYQIEILKNTISPEEFFAKETKSDLAKKLEKAKAPQPPPQDGDEEAPKVAPEAPGALKVMDCGTDSLTLCWLQPRKNGPITDYIVMGMKEGATQWEEFDTTGGETRYKVTSIPQGKWTFGVVAINAVGKSEPATFMTSFDGENSPMIDNIDRITYEDYLATKPKTGDGSKAPPVRVGKQRRLSKRDLEVWEACNKVVITDTSYTVKSLQSGSKPSFRVIAINDYGESRSSNVVGPITCKDDIIFPGIEVLGFKEIEEGNKLEIFAKVSGNPLPEIEWLKDDKVITSDGNSKTSDSNNYKIQTEIGSTCLAIDEANRSDSGYYSIRASNVAGNGLKQIKVVILSKPGPPLGPVSFTSVSAQSQSISWLPPVDDGGCHISHYIVQRCVTDRQYWADVGEDIRSCEATSTDLHKGKYYIYRVAAVNQYGQGPFIKSEPCQAKNSCEVAERMAPPLVEGVQRDSMTVTWEPPTSDGGGNIIGYVLERRTRIQRKWTRAVHELISGTQYRVRGLNDGTEYLFRVSAVNAAGTNEPSLPSNGAIARPPIKVPSEPRNIGVKDSTETSLTLKWNAPENDGGAKVRGYFIEKHYQGTRTIPEDPEDKPEELWERVFGTEVRAHEASIKNLEKGKIIKFRVRAVNEAGEGQAGELASYAKVEEQIEDPEIKLDSLLKDGLTIKTGKQLRLVAYVSGRPEPSCDWLFNGGAVPEHARMEESQFSRTLSIRSAEREHTGVYTITCTSGDKVISRDIKVNVLSIPSAPTGPLSVGNIIKDSVTLEWEKPCDCGGTEVTNYIVEKREASRRSWTKISMSVTRTKLVVQGLLPDEQYMFRVAAENVIGVGPFLDTKIPIVSRDPMGTPTRPEDVKYEDVMKSHVTLSWKAPSFDGGSPITHYIVEKRRVGSERYIEASDKAFLECHATLGGFSEGDNFEFRVIPFNEMGAGKPSFPTKPVICRDTIVGPKLEFDCRSKMIARVGNSLQIPALITGKPAPKVTWTHNNNELKSQDRIRVKNMIGSSSILSINEAIRSDSGVYQIKLENAAGCRTGKVEVVIADKPTPVTNLDVVEVSRENVIIKWDAPEDDGGEEISNYVVEKKDLQKMMWLTVNNACLKNEIRISKLRENGEFQFRVMAENSYGLSDPQDTPTVIIRDRYKVPDASDGVRAREVFKNHVMLEWNKPYDGGKRILNYRVEKRETQSERWVRVTKELISEPKYTVKDLLEGNEYEFRVFAQNSIGYSPPSVPSKAVICSDPINPPSMPINISVVDIRKKEVTVQWGLPRHDGGAKIDGYIVETNKVGTDSWKTWCTAETQSSCRFTIPDLVESFEYYVRVKAVNKAGQSEPGMMRDKVVVVDKLAPPEIQCDGNMLHDRVVKAGNELVLSATILGTPEPSVKWIKNDPINGDHEMESKFCHKSDNGHVKLIIMDAGRVHTGRYSLIVENSIGKKQCSTYVAVLDIPSVPRDLQMSEVRADGLRLRWKQPADDGGTVISHYRVERIAKSDGSMNHWKPIALSQKKCNIDVKYLIEGECYKFRVYAENCFGIGDYAETDEIQARNPIFPPSIPQNLEIVDIQKDNVTLQWQKPGRDGGSVVSAYRVEYCSEDIDEYGESKQTAWSTFKTVSTYKCTVTGLEEGKPFKFRVRAINEAGEGRADTTIPITPIQPLVPPKIDIDIKILEGLTVRAGSTITIPAFIKGYPRPKLQWANQMGDGIDQSDDRIEIREDENSTRLTIKNACRKDSGEYSLSARNESGAKSVLIHVQVLDRPSPPVGPIEIEEMTPEYAIITWNPPKDDGGSDLTNYIIEKTII